jgi:PTH2 family peptidyl-tRNA hydrolase
MDKVQQTIVMRTKFPDGNGGFKKLRSGKYCSQASHASIAFLNEKFRNARAVKTVGIDEHGNYYDNYVSAPNSLSDEENLWIHEEFTKICLCVESEEELLDIYNRAKNEGLTVHLIQDAGHTEFNGVSTYTCLAIGPHYKSKIDSVTKDLKLF